MTDTHSLSVSIQYLNRTLQASDLADVPDVELVGRFVEGRDEAAFAALVKRHGPLVLGACRRVLRHEQDAEDAFQATFLVFARDAASVRRAEGIGNWLYGVAFNVARRAKTARHRRAIKESEAAIQHPSTVQAANTDELREVLDLEINSLPAKYRAAIVLCDLMGLTTQQAATETGCPPKTLGTRLARGRTLLAQRLRRHGLSLPAAGLAALLAPCAKAALPSRLLDLTNRAATEVTASSPVTVPLAVASLTERVSKIMVFKNLKIVAILAGSVLFVGGLAMHGGFAVHATSGSSGEAGGSGDPPVGQAARHATVADHLDHLRRLIDHLGDMLGQVGLGRKGAEALAVDAGKDDQKEDKEKPTLSGEWVQKDGELKIEFSDKNTMSISPHGENKVVVILCEYTLNKDGLVKAKVTGFEGKAEAKKMVMEHLPTGTQFSFTWKVKDDKAALDDVKGEKDKIELLKSRLETEYRKK